MGDIADVYEQQQQRQKHWTEMQPGLRSHWSPASNHSSWAGEEQISAAGGVDHPLHQHDVQTEWGSNWYTCSLNTQAGLTTMTGQKKGAHVTVSRVSHLSSG